MQISPAINPAKTLDRYLRRFKRPEEYRPKVIKIIEMSKEGRTLEEIRDTVKMSKREILILLGDGADRRGCGNMAVDNQYARPVIACAAEIEVLLSVI